MYPSIFMLTFSKLSACHVCRFALRHSSRLCKVIALLQSIPRSKPTSVKLHESRKTAPILRCNPSPSRALIPLLLIDQAAFSISVMATVFVLSSFAVGVASHILLLKRGEWERYAPAVVMAHGTLPMLAFAYLLLVGRRPLVSAIIFVIGNSAGYYAGLFGSIAVYRLLWHPLRSFPGPTAAKLTSWWATSKAVPDFHFHDKLKALHETYGDFVRIRPREISINHPDAVQDIHGLRTTCLKGPFYDLNYPARSLQMTRDKHFHAQRRRLWDRGFSIRGKIT